jgi:ABC-type multidrug transport system permease subunit
VIDLSGDDLSALFVDQLREDGYWIELKPAQSQAALKKSWPYGVVIPANFSDSVRQGKRIDLTLVKGNGAPDRLLEVQSRLTQAIVRFTKGLVQTDIAHREWNDASKAELKAALERPQLLTVSRQSHRTLRPPPTGFSQSLPGMLVMFVVQMILTYGGESLVRDRRGGQLVRLMAAPLHALEAYGGKMLARILLASIQAALLLLCGALLFKMPLGDHPLFLIPVVLSLAIFASMLSVLAGLVCQNEKQVILAAIFASMILAALGGCWWPIEIVPPTFQTIAMLTPNYWAMHGLQSILYFGNSYDVLIRECPMLLGFAVACAGGVLLLTRGRARRAGAMLIPAGPGKSELEQPVKSRST